MIRNAGSIGGGIGAFIGTYYLHLSITQVLAVLVPVMIGYTIEIVFR